MNTIRDGVILLAMALVLTACSGMEARRPPFYIHNSPVLNETPAPNYPREDRFDPLGTEVEWSYEAVAARDKPAARPKAATSGIIGWRTDKEDGVAAVVDAPAAPAPSAQASAPPPAVPVPVPTLKTAPASSDASPAPVEPPSPAVEEAPKAPAAPSSGGKVDATASRHAAEFIQALYKINGVKVKVGQGEEAIAAMHEDFKQRGRIYHATRPAVGDVVFFHNSFDRNGDGRNNDWFTHVGLVEAVEDDGTIHVLSYLGGQVSAFTINLEHPRVGIDPDGGRTWNHVLRPRDPSDPPFTQYLGGELFAGFGSLLGDRAELMVIDNWTPGMKL